MLVSHYREKFPLSIELIESFLEKNLNDQYSITTYRKKVIEFFSKVYNWEIKIDKTFGKSYVPINWYVSKSKNLLDNECFNYKGTAFNVRKAFVDLLEKLLTWLEIKIKESEKVEHE